MAVRAVRGTGPRGQDEWGHLDEQVRRPGISPGTAAAGREDAAR